MAAPVRNGVELNAVRKLHVVALLEPLALANAFLVSSEGALVGVLAGLDRVVVVELVCGSVVQGRRKVDVAVKAPSSLADQGRIGVGGERWRLRARSRGGSVCDGRRLNGCYAMAWEEDGEDRGKLAGWAREWGSRGHGIKPCVMDGCPPWTQGCRFLGCTHRLRCDKCGGTGMSNMAVAKKLQE